jgi:hypothetical protein
VKTNFPVPATAATVRTAAGRTSTALTDAHCTDVDDDHDAVLHVTELSNTVADSSTSPKLKPLTVTAPPPLSGMLLLAADTTGAAQSKLCAAAHSSNQNNSLFLNQIQSIVVLSLFPLHPFHTYHQS